MQALLLSCMLLKLFNTLSMRVVFWHLSKNSTWCQNKIIKMEPPPRKIQRIFFLQSTLTCNNMSNMLMCRQIFLFLFKVFHFMLLSLFPLFEDLFFKYIYLCGYVHCIWVQMLMGTRGSTGGCDPLGVGAGNWTLVFCSTCFLLLSHL